MVNLPVLVDCRTGPKRHCSSYSKYLAQDLAASFSSMSRSALPHSLTWGLGRRLTNQWNGRHNRTTALLSLQSAEQNALASLLVQGRQETRGTDAKLCILPPELRMLSCEAPPLRPAERGQLPTDYELTMRLPTGTPLWSRYFTPALCSFLNICACMFKIPIWRLQKGLSCFVFFYDPKSKKTGVTLQSLDKYLVNKTSLKWISGRSHNSPSWQHKPQITTMALHLVDFSWIWRVCINNKS